jgi:hypothetical protein
MSSKQVMIVIALVAVCAWSAVMALLGQTAAVAALIPSLGLLVQQIAQALSSVPSPPPKQPAAQGDSLPGEDTL